MDKLDRQEIEQFNTQEWETLDRESTEDEVREALFVDEIVEAAKACRRNDSLLISELRKAGIL